MTKHRPIPAQRLTSARAQSIFAYFHRSRDVSRSVDFDDFAQEVRLAFLTHVESRLSSDATDDVYYRALAATAGNILARHARKVVLDPGATKLSIDDELAGFADLADVAIEEGDDVDPAVQHEAEVLFLAKLSSSDAELLEAMRSKSATPPPRRVPSSRQQSTVALRLAAIRKELGLNREQFMQALSIHPDERSVFLHVLGSRDSPHADRFLTTAEELLSTRGDSLLQRKRDLEARFSGTTSEIMIRLGAVVSLDPNQWTDCQKLAAVLKVSPASVRRWMRNETKPPLDRLEKYWQTVVMLAKKQSAVPAERETRTRHTRNFSKSTHP